MDFVLEFKNGVFSGESARLEDIGLAVGVGGKKDVAAGGGGKHQLQIIVVPILLIEGQHHPASSGCIARNCRFRRLVRGIALCPVNELISLGF